MNAPSLSGAASDVEGAPLLAASLGRAGTAAAAAARSRDTTRFVLVVSATAAISGACFGYEIGALDAVLAMSSFRRYFGTVLVDNAGVETDAPDRDATDGDVIAAFLVGAMAGSVLVAWLADARGRRQTLIVGAAFFLAGGSLQTAAPALSALLVGRALSGVGIGLLSMCAPLYVSEAAPARSRGRLVALVQLMITVGILLASVVNAGLFAGATGEAQWRAALGAQLAPGLALAALLPWMPESPRWLAAAGRRREALAVLARLRGAAPDAPEVVAELDGMAPGGEGSGGGGGGGGGNDKGGSDSAGGDGDEGGGPGSKAARPGGSPSSRCCDASGWAPLLRGGGLKRLAVACALQCLQQLTGINVVLYYASRLFAELGVPPEHAATTLVGVNALLLVLGTVPGLLLVDSPSVGRRRLLVYGGAGMAACHAVVAAALLGVDGAGGGSPAGAAAGWAAVAAMLSFTVVFSATWGPTVWVVQSEIFAGAGERARGGAVATLMNWLSNAILGKVAPLMLTAIGPYTYVVFAATCAGMTAFAATCVPETGGRTLEEMGDVLT